MEGKLTSVSRLGPQIVGVLFALIDQRQWATAQGRCSRFARNGGMKYIQNLQQNGSFADMNVPVVDLNGVFFWLPL